MRNLSLEHVSLYLKHLLLIVLWLSVVYDQRLVLAMRTLCRHVTCYTALRLTSYYIQIVFLWPIGLKGFLCNNDSWLVSYGHLNLRLVTCSDLILEYSNDMSILPMCLFILQHLKCGQHFRLFLIHDSVHLFFPRLLRSDCSLGTHWLLWERESP